MAAPRVLNSWRQNLSAAGYIAGWKVVAYLPAAITRPLFTLGADIASRRGKGMPQLRKNLARVVGESNVTDRLVRDSMRSYARYWLESFRLPRMVGEPNLVERYHSGMIGTDILEASLSAGKGVVLVLPHSGNWDMAGMYLAAKYESFTTVAERLKPESLYDAFVDFRESLGFSVVPHQGTTGPYERLLEVVQQGGVVALLGERDLKKSGVEVEFFGETTRMPSGAARLALDSGAPLHVAHCWFDGSGWGTKVSPALEGESVAELVQAIARGFEENIREHPVDWHMLQPLWLKDLDHERYARGIS